MEVQNGFDDKRKWIMDVVGVLTLWNHDNL